MSCPCKKTINRASKYAEEGDQGLHQGNTNFFIRLGNIILSVVGGIITGALFIIVAVPVVLWITVQVVMGKEPVIRIPAKAMARLANRGNKVETKEENG